MIGTSHCVEKGERVGKSEEWDKRQKGQSYYENGKKVSFVREDSLA